MDVQSRHYQHWVHKIQDEYKQHNKNKGNNKITEHRVIFQRESQTSKINKQTNQSTTGKLGKLQWP